MLIYTSKSPRWGRQKPRQWGSLSAVRSAVFRNAEARGIDPQSIILYMPFWEGAGEAISMLFGPVADWEFRSDVGWNAKGNGIDFPGENYDRCEITISADDPNYNVDQHTLIMHLQVTNLLNNDSDAVQTLFKLNPIEAYFSSGGALRTQRITNSTCQRAVSQDGLIANGDNFQAAFVLPQLGINPSIYVNGVAVPLSLQTGGNGTITPSGDFGLGCREGYDWANQYYGAMYSVLRFSSLLNASTIGQLYETPYALLQPNPTPLIFDWGAAGGWAGTIYGITPAKIMGVSVDNISKVVGVE